MSRSGEHRFVEPFPPRAGPPVDALVAGWRSAFRAARSALDAASPVLPQAERAEEARRLGAELAPTQLLLADFARERGELRFLPLLVSPLGARHLLALPPEVMGCVFNLDGVLIGSADMHAAAWAKTFDPFLLERGERTHGSFPLFDLRRDYAAHLHGRPRLDGVRAFLASRGIRLPDGRPDDPPGTGTVYGLANRKNALFTQMLESGGIAAFDGSRSYLELAHEAGIGCAVVSASAHTDEILEAAGLAELIDVRVDGPTIQREQLRLVPAPDTLLAACRRLDIAPSRVAAFETTRAGVAAGRSAGFDLVIGVAGATGADPRSALTAEGADVVVHGVGELLERRLAA